MQRYPQPWAAPRLFARLSRFLAAQGDDVTVFTSDALDPKHLVQERLASLRRASPKMALPSNATPSSAFLRAATSSKHYRCFQTASGVVSHLLATPFPGMWHDAKQDSRRFDVVHATAFPYAWPILCTQAGSSRGQHFPDAFSPPGRPDDLQDRTRRAYLSASLRSLLLEADGIFA